MLPAFIPYFRIPPLRIGPISIEPFGVLWFIYLLPIFFLVTKATRAVPPILVWIAAAALEIAPIATGATVIDEFAARFVYFYTGYLFAPRIFALAHGRQAKDRRIILPVRFESIRYLKRRHRHACVAQV